MNSRRVILRSQCGYADSKLLNLFVIAPRAAVILYHPLSPMVVRSFRRKSTTLVLSMPIHIGFSIKQQVIPLPLMAGHACARKPSSMLKSFVYNAANQINYKPRTRLAGRLLQHWTSYNTRSKILCFTDRTSNKHLNLSLISLSLSLDRSIALPPSNIA